MKASSCFLAALLLGVFPVYSSSSTQDLRQLEHNDDQNLMINQLALSHRVQICKEQKCTHTEKAFVHDDINKVQKVLQRDLILRTEHSVVHAGATVDDHSAKLGNLRSQGSSADTLREGGRRLGFSFPEDKKKEDDDWPSSSVDISASVSASSDATDAAAALQYAAP
ncbi:unnamed protein product, partial [Heterosigma akashiwo]